VRHHTLKGASLCWTTVEMITEFERIPAIKQLLDILQYGRTQLALMLLTKTLPVTVFVLEDLFDCYAALYGLKHYDELKYISVSSLWPSSGRITSSMVNIPQCGQMISRSKIGRVFSVITFGKVTLPTSQQNSLSHFLQMKCSEDITTILPHSPYGKKDVLIPQR
jgi:hypothetical protein